jgi:hypothetical protein
MDARWLDGELMSALGERREWNFAEQTSDNCMKK